MALGTVIAFLLILGAAEPTPMVGSSKTTSDYSDLAMVSDNVFLAVTDRKTPVESGCRVMLLNLTGNDGVQVQPVTVMDWCDSEDEPSDLEACCKIPGRANEFLLAESGCYHGKYGRVFHVTLNLEKSQAPELIVNGVMRIYDRQLNAEQGSYSGDNVAGMVCFEAAGNLVLAFGERGGETAHGRKLGTLVWGQLDLKEYHFNRWGESPLVNKSVLQSRDCAALHLTKMSDGSFSLLSVATQDPGGNGPFYSVVFRAGKFVPGKVEGRFEFQRCAALEVLSTIDGHKVEGLASAVSNAPHSDFSISTDDENLGGVWRAITIDH